MPGSLRAILFYLLIASVIGTMWVADCANALKREADQGYWPALNASQSPTVAIADDE